MRRSQRQRDGKRAALTDGAADADVSPVQSDQFLHQRQPDAAALKSAARAAPDPMEAFKHVRQFLSRNAHARVCDRNFNRLVTLAQRNADFALKGILKGIGEEIENDFLPHLMIDVDRLAQGRAVNSQAHASTLDDRAEATGKIGCQGRQVGSYTACTRPASMREKSSRVLTSFNRRRALRCRISARSRCSGKSA